MYRKLKFLVAGLLFVFVSPAQNGFFDYSSIGLQYYHGSGIGNTFKRLRDSDPSSLEIYYQRQVNVSPAWNHTKRLPQWGIGLFTTNSGSRKYIGTMVCAYPYMKLPLFSAGPLESNFRFGFGLAWVQKIYNKETNPENLLLSQKINTHANLSWQNEIRLTPHHFISAGLSFYHASNAKRTLPNLGINIPAVSVGYRYAFHAETKKPVQRNDSLNKKIFYRIFLSAGVKEMQVPDSSRYFVKLLSVEACKQVSYSSTISIGLFITQDASVRTDTLVKHLGGIRTSQVALYGSYEYHFGKFLIPVQVGVFVYNSNSKIVESIGLRYQFSKNWLAEFLLKSHFYRADLMHLGIGYRF
jgi:Lipid A 3-O-deacylase (PagL)